MTSLKLHLQDPGAPSGYLLEELLGAISGATRGGATFAWTNATGAKALLTDDSFGRFLEGGTFDLVVGVDSITDEAAVKVLIEASNKSANLSVRVFLHSETALFHPKMAWFESADGITLLVGSGNLTMGGLKGNWEVFLLAQLTGSEAQTLIATLDAWRTKWVGSMLPITDPRVLERAKLNAGSERTLKRSRGPVPPALAQDETSEILLAEIPMAGGRWSQANFDLENYEGFFGAKVGTQRRILLYHVTDVGSVDDVEIRPSVEVLSHNYRFELAAAKGLHYPNVDDGRPIAAFMKLLTGSFLYMLIMPDNPHHAAVSACLQAKWSGPAGRMRRVRLSVADLRSCWPGSPLWIAKVPDL